MHVSSSNSSAELTSAKASKYSIWPKWTDDELVPDKRVSAMHGLKRGTDCIMAMQPKVIIIIIVSFWLGIEQTNWWRCRFQGKKRDSPLSRSK